MGLPRSRRITSPREITELLEGERARGSSLEVFWRPATEARSRATCVVPKFGHGSVERNRLRRRLQELTRGRILGRGDSRDWLVRARPGAYESSFDDLAEQLRVLSDRADRENAVGQ